MQTLTTISRSMLRPSSVFSILALVLLAFTFKASGQNASDNPIETQSSSVQISEWYDGVSAAVRFLHTLFPDINPRSRILIEDNDEWRLSQGRLYTFTINICDPVFSRHSEVKFHCSVTTVHATFLVGVEFPSQINVGTPALEKRWGELFALLHAHPKWTSAQAENAMRASGVKYGAGADDEVILIIQHMLTKLEPFFGKLKVDSVKYYAPQPFGEGLPLPPNWRVAAHSIGQNSKTSGVRYLLTFSAFDGSFESALMLGEAQPSKTQ